MSGAIPPELGQLTNLTALSLWDNQLSGAIPPELGQLTNLTHLNLFQNQLSGPLPETFLALTRLNYLDMRETDLCVPTGARFDRWVESIGSFLGIRCEQADDHGNTLDTATRVGAPSDTRGVLETEGDIDVFRFRLDSPGYLYVYGSGDTPIEGSISGTLDNGQGFSIPRLGGASPDDFVHFSYGWETATPGDFVLSVWGAATGEGSATGPYAVHVSFEPEAETRTYDIEYHPNYSASPLLQLLGAQPFPEEASGDHRVALIRFPRNTTFFAPAPPSRRPQRGLGLVASEGLRMLAETGNPAGLLWEADFFGSSPLASTFDEITALLSAGEITLSEDFPCLSYFQRLIPSADWFIGFHLACAVDGNGDWLDEIEIRLEMWDAGTAEGEPYGEKIGPTNPQEPISRVMRPPWDTDAVAEISMTLRR